MTKMDVILHETSRCADIKWLRGNKKKILHKSSAKKTVTH